MMIPTLYTFRRCPYAIRTRFTLALCKIKCTQIEVDFKDKPAEMLALSPKGTVPVLVLNETGEVIDESLDIMHWALAKTTPCPLLINDAANELIALSDGAFKNHLDRYKYHTRYTDSDPEHHRIEAEKFLENLNSCLTQHEFLVSDHISIADIAIFPFIRQYSNINREIFDQLPFPHLHAWLKNWLNHPIFEQIMVKTYNLKF